MASHSQMAGATRDLLRAVALAAAALYLVLFGWEPRVDGGVELARSPAPPAACAPPAAGPYRAGADASAPQAACGPGEVTVATRR